MKEKAMKPLKSNAKMKVFLILLIATAVIGSSSNAQTSHKKTKVLSEKGRVNLLAGISSDNPGVKRDCIYFAALYGIKEAEKILIEESENVKDPSTRVLIALALYKLGEQDVNSGIFTLALDDWHYRVGEISDLIVKDINASTIEAIAGKTK